MVAYFLFKATVALSAFVTELDRLTGQHCIL